MKHSICGFNHAALLLNFKCNYDDAQILRCIVDFMSTGKMQQVNIEGKIYFWVFYQWLLDQLPGLHCKNSRVLSRWMDKYVDNRLMERYVANGNRTYYRFIEEQYETLVSYPKEKMVTPVLQSTPPCTPEYTPPVLQSTPIDYSLIDSSTRREKEVKDIYDSYPSRDENNQNRSTGKCSKDKDKIAKILKTKTKEELATIIDSYLAECKRTKTYLKNFSALLNNLPEPVALPEPKKPQFSGLPDNYYQNQTVRLPDGSPFHPENK